MAEEEKKEAESKKDDDGKAPIIIKRISAGGHGHHGGAWKVAYADFVTAMMAFFLLMWLLNAVPAETLSGIAQYFEPTVGIGGQKGIGFYGGQSQSNSGRNAYDKQHGVKFGVIRSGEVLANPQQGDEVSIEEMENERFSLIEGELNKVIINDSELRAFQESISFEQTPEGLKIKIMDQDKYPMFKPGSAELQSYAKNIIAKIAKLIRYSPNYISISGHTDKASNNLGDLSYTNWELSADRANAARRHLIESSISREQIARIVSKADTELLDRDNPYSPRNRRITIILLRNSIMPFHKVSAPKELITSPSRNDFEDHLNVIK